MGSVNILCGGIVAVEEHLANYAFESNKKYVVKIHTAVLSSAEAVSFARQIKDLIPNATIVGCSVNAVLHEANVYQDKTLISITPFENVHLSSILFPLESLSNKQHVEEIISRGLNFYPSASIVLFGRDHEDVNSFVETISENMPNVPFVGGVASALTNVGAYVFNESVFLENGFSLTYVSSETSTAKQDEADYESVRDICTFYAAQKDSFARAIAHEHILDIKNLATFLQANEANEHKQICFIQSSSFSTKGEEKQVKRYFAQDTVKEIKEFLKKNAAKFSAELYICDRNSLFFVAETSVSDAFFVNIAQSVYERCRELYTQEIMSYAHKFTVSLKGAPIQELLQYSDSQEVDEEGFAFSIFGDADGEDLLRQESEVVNLLEHVIKENTVEPYFQGIYDNKTNSFFCYEALMRIKDFDGKILMPKDFMQVAFKYNLYLSLSISMVMKLFDIFENRKEIININISIVDIRSDEFQKALFERLNTMKNPERFIFELVETEKYEDYELMRNFIRRVKKRGIKVAIDDFGVGYSNFAEMGSLEIDYVKIDGALVSLLGADSDFDTIMESVFYLSKKMQIELIAERVETADMQNILVRNGVNYSQGYYFSKPVSFEEMVALSQQNEKKLGSAQNIVKEFDGISKYTTAVQKEEKRLVRGAVLTSLFAIAALFVFMLCSQKNVQEQSHALARSYTENIANQIGHVVFSSAFELSNIKEDTYNKILRTNEPVPTVLDNKNTLFDDIYLSFDDTKVKDEAGNTIDLGEKRALHAFDKEEIIFSYPLTDEKEGKDFFVLGLPIYDGYDKLATLYGRYNADTFLSSLASQANAAQKDFDVYDVDGKIFMTNQKGSDFQARKDLYSFIESLDIQNEQTVASARRNITEGNSTLIEFVRDGAEYIAVITPVMGTPLSVMSITLHETSLYTLRGIGGSVFWFFVGILSLFFVYSIVAYILLRKTQKELLEALEISFSLTNSLQTSIRAEALNKKKIDA